jgi:hypothetical protein
MIVSHGGGCVVGDLESEVGDAEKMAVDEAVKGPLFSGIVCRISTAEVEEYLSCKVASALPPCDWHFMTRQKYFWNASLLETTRCSASARDVPSSRVSSSHHTRC